MYNIRLSWLHIPELQRMDYYMNEKKFCFIMCTNNELYMSESLHYIEHLIIPDGYEIDVLTVQDASSITQGYNEAMEQSDAKYKIYLHQDVFILNPNFLNDLLQIFNSDKKIGMIGMIGYENVSPDGLMWHGRSKGKIYIRTLPSINSARTDCFYSFEQDNYSYVAEIDGLLMATCVDLPWDTENITGWDFYDAFHSMEFLLNGYSIAVPNQRAPWCLHDDGVVLNLTHYNKYRQIFLKKYEKYLGKSYKEIQEECMSSIRY